MGRMLNVDAELEEKIPGDLLAVICLFVTGEILLNSIEIFLSIANILNC